MGIFRSRLRDRCKTLAADRQWFLVRDSYIPCERKGRWLSPRWREKACFVDSGWTFRPLKRPRPRERRGLGAGMTGVSQWSQTREKRSNYCREPAATCRNPSNQPFIPFYRPHSPRSCTPYASLPLNAVLTPVTSPTHPPLHVLKTAKNTTIPPKNIGNFRQFRQSRRVAFLPRPEQLSDFCNISFSVQPVFAPSNRYCPRIHPQDLVTPTTHGSSRVLKTPKKPSKSSKIAAGSRQFWKIPRATFLPRPEQHHGFATYASVLSPFSHQISVVIHKYARKT